MTHHAVQTHAISSPDPTALEALEAARSSAGAAWDTAHATWSAAHAGWAAANASSMAALATFCAVAFALFQPVAAHLWSTWRNRVAADGEMRRAFALIEESYSTLPSSGAVEEHELWTLLNKNNVSRRLLEHWMTSPLGNRRYAGFLMATLQAMYEVRDAIKGSQPNGSWAVSRRGDGPLVGSLGEQSRELIPPGRALESVPAGLKPTYL